MPWPREDACAGQPGMPPMLLARQQSSRTSWVRPPMRSRPHVLPRRKERARAQGGSSAGGSATSSRRRFASSYSTTSGCGTTSVGRCSTAESASGHLSLRDESCSCPCRYVEQQGMAIRAADVSQDTFRFSQITFLVDFFKQPKKRHY